MEQKQRLFIYDRREVVVLVLLGVMIAAFAFTLGVHLGKSVTPQAAPSSATTENKPIGTLQDTLPNRQELTEQGHNAQAAADAELTKTLHDEVEKTGIKFTTPRQVDLPTKTASKNAGATTLQAEAKAPAQPPAQQIDSAAAQSDVNTGETTDVAASAFTLQVGSFPSAEEAQTKMDALRSQGLRPYVRAAQVRGLGRRFRIYRGGFATKEDAESAGRKYLSQRMIDSYLVSRSEQD